MLPLVGCVAAGCSGGPGEDLGTEETSGNESELSVNEIVKKGTVLRVTASALNFRAYGSLNAKILTVLPHGTLVTCVATSGETGWVHVTAQGLDGWVYGRYVVRQGGGGGGQTCDPSRADGVVGKYSKALHDTIAWAEGTRGVSRDGYNVMFSYKLFWDCGAHPNQCLKFGSTCSTAAGRYQFLNGTWKSVKAARNLDSFEPENQERGALYLVTAVRKVNVPAGRPMSAAELSNAMDKLSWEWASLPPSRYGQGNKTLSQVRSTYCSLAGC
jgi:muramidase (phage lysozyme)